MNAELIALAEKRGELKARIAMQRDALAENIWPVEGLLHMGDRAVDGVHWLQRHPQVVVGAAVALVVARPRRVVRMIRPLWGIGRRGFVYWQTFQRLRKKLQGID
ncbi:MAG: YqjK family protein [Betaproteobacteria bacterium]